MASLSTAELEKFRKLDYEHSGRSQMSWETSAQVLKRAADHLLKAYRQDRAKAGPCRVVAEGGPGWEEANDSRLIPVYYLLMGYAVEDYVKAIIIINHPEYLTDDGLTRIDKHETYDLLNENGIPEFKKYDEILHQLVEYVTSMGRYPITKKFEDYKTIYEPIDSDQLNCLLNDLYKRSKLERRLDILRRKGIAKTFREFVEIQEEICAFITPEVSMKDIRDQYPQYAKDLIIQVMQNLAEDIADRKNKRYLRMVIDRWDLGYEDDKIGICV